MHVPAWITIPNNITAIQLHRTQSGKEQLGAISQLPRDSELRICGNGFNPGTVKVQYGGHFYFVFLQDLEQTHNIE